MIIFTRCDCAVTFGRPGCLDFLLRLDYMNTRIPYTPFPSQKLESRGSRVCILSSFLFGLVHHQHSDKDEIVASSIYSMYYTYMRILDTVSLGTCGSNSNKV